MQHESLKRRLLSLCVSGLFLAAILLLYGFNYSINDDPTMVSILNGSYTGTPDGHAIFIKYPLAWTIKTLYTLTASVPWYSVVLLGCYWLAMGFLLCQLLARFPRHPLLLCLIFVGAMSLLWVTEIVRFTFSTCGAYVSAASFLSYALIPREEDLKPDKLAPLLILFWLSYCIRDYFALASLLFLAIVWFGKYYDRMFREWRCWLIPVVGVLGLVLCMVCNSLAYSSPEWKDFLEYNDKRSYVQDYAGMPGYKKNTAFYESLGYSAKEKKCISSYTYVLLEDFTPETFEEIYDYVKSTEKTPSLKKTIKKTLKDTVKHYLLMDKEDFGTLQAASLLAPAALFLTALYLSVKDRRHHWVIPMMMLFGMGCMWLYISYAGRYPPRVALSLRIITVCGSLAGFAAMLSRRPIHALSLEKKSIRVSALILSVAAAAAGLALAWTDVGHHATEARAFYYVYADEHPEDIFIRDTNLSYDNMEDSPSLNMVSTGGWLHYSPLYEEKLQNWGVMNSLNRSSLVEPNVYLMASSKRNLRNMIGLDDDEPLEYEVVAEQDGVSVYHFSQVGALTAD